MRSQSFSSIKNNKLFYLHGALHTSIYTGSFDKVFIDILKNEGKAKIFHKIRTFSWFKQTVLDVFFFLSSKHSTEMSKGIEYLIFKQVTPWSQKSVLQQFNRFVSWLTLRSSPLKGKLELIQRRN